jgi:hypothetical protein
MNKKALFLAVCGFVVAAFMIAPVVSADEMVPGSYAQQDQSVMGVGQTMVQMGARDRALTDAVNKASRAHQSLNEDGVNANYQWGESQQDNSWKAAKTVEEAEVFGLVPGDCQGDNSGDAYRKQMGQNRDGYMKEVLVSNADCAKHHATLK